MLYHETVRHALSKIHPKAVLHALSKIYHATVTPFYVWLGNKMGGRAKSGRNARYGRLGRVFGNVVSLAIIGVAIALKGWGPFWEAGAVLPLWAVLGLGAGIGINFIGWLASAAANHLKIEQYYDAEMELHAENDELLNKQTKLTGRFRKFSMNTARTLHDINSYTGTAVGIATGIPMMLTLISVATYSFNPALAATFFIVSRASALASVICVWGTNQFRLWTYKKCLQQEMDIYYQLKKEPGIESIVNDAIRLLGASADKTYTQWVKFRCCKALEGAWIEDSLTASRKQLLIECLQNILKEFVDSHGEFSREKLMTINGCDAPKVSVLDSMLILESKLFDKFSEFLNVQKHQVINSNMSLSPHVKNPLLSYHLKRNLFKEDNVQEKMIAVDQAAMPDPVSVKTAHGSVFLPYYGARKMAEAIIATPPTPTTPAGTPHESHDRENLVQ